MRNFVRVLVAVTSVLTALSATGIAHAGDARPSEGTADEDTAYVMTLLFETPLGDFSAIAKNRIGPDGAFGDAWFEWKTDLCSAPLVGNTGRSFNFTEPCRRHDFGYRNVRLLDRRYGNHSWNSDARKRIDEQFLADMKGHCHHRRLLDRPTCYSWAYTFYSVVRIAGGP